MLLLSLLGFFAVFVVFIVVIAVVFVVIDCYCSSLIRRYLNQINIRCGAKEGARHTTVVFKGYRPEKAPSQAPSHPYPISQWV